MDQVQELLKARYFVDGETTWGQLARRVAEYLFSDERTEPVFEAIRDKEFIPSSPILMNAGRKVPMLHSCFTLGIEDDMESILKAFHDTMMIQKFGGGVGINFSPLRAKGKSIGSTGGQASGPVSFMKMWNTGMDVVKQAGKRQGALMGVLDASHPDIREFISAKQTEGDLSNFNISVMLHDGIMSNPNLELPCGLSAGELMDEIVDAAWRNGEPGVLFYDNINRNNPYDEPITCVNPCGEVPIPSNGACCLGSINLAACVVNGEFDFAKLRRLAKIGFQVLDESINAGVYATEEIKRFESRNRPLGLGVMGYATALIGMKMEYGSREALTFLRSVLLEMKMVGRELLGLNNATLLSIAPTGTISMIAGVSYGIEPLFSVAYNKVVDAGAFPVIEPTLAEYEIDDWEPVLATGSVQGTSLPPHVKRLFRTAGEIDPLTHLYVQAAAQEVVDNAVSKTINLPNGTTREAIKALFYRAWELGIKGLTVYRDGSRQVQVINGYDESCPNGTCSL